MAPQAPEVPEYRCPRCGSTRAIGRMGTTERASGTGPGSIYEAVTRAFMTCEDCKLVEDLLDDIANHDAYVVALQRWRNPAFDETKPYYSTIDFHAETRDRMLKADARDRSRTWPEDPWRELFEYEAAYEKKQRESRAEGLFLPENDALFAKVLADPEDRALRWEYAAWLNEQPRSTYKDYDGKCFTSPDEPKYHAWYMTAQLRTWDALQIDPKADVAAHMYDAAENYQTNILKLRATYDSVGKHHFLCVNFVDQHWYICGFIEHVAIKAPVFLRFAKFLYSIAPLRHLTLTYAKTAMAVLAASPHLARIRTLRLPNRMLNNEYTRLNELVDDDIAVLASSPHLADLTLLDLEDNDRLTIRAFDHLALSPHLRSLSHVAFDVYYYDREFGRFGDYRRELREHRNELWRDELEARHGYLPWLHPEEHYGVPQPLLEQVNAHPVGVASFRPDVAARRRAHLPAHVLAAIAACVIVDGQIELVKRAIIVPLYGPGGASIGRLVATIVDVVPDPAISDLRALVTLTIAQLNVPVPHAMSSYDHATGANVVLAEDQTLTVGIPLRAYALATPKLPTPQAP
jgi:hypothetical protein